MLAPQAVMLQIYPISLGLEGIKNQLLQQLDGLVFVHMGFHLGDGMGI